MPNDPNLTDDDADFLAYLVAVGIESRHAIDAEPELVPAVAALIDRHDRVFGVYPDAREIGGYGFLAIKTNGTAGYPNTALLCDSGIQATTWMAMLGDLRDVTAERITAMRSRGLLEHQIDEMLFTGVAAGAEVCDGFTVGTMLREAALINGALSSTKKAN